MELIIHKGVNSLNNPFEEGCQSIFVGTIIIIAIIAMVVISAASMASSGFFGLLMGPLVVGIVAFVIAGIFS